MDTPTCAFRTPVRGVEEGRGVPRTLACGREHGTSIGMLVKVGGRGGTGIGRPVGRRPEGEGSTGWVGGETDIPSRQHSADL